MPTPDGAVVAGQGHSGLASAVAIMTPWTQQFADAGLESFYRAKLAGVRLQLAAQIHLIGKGRGTARIAFLIQSFHRSGVRCCVQCAFFFAHRSCFSR